MQSIAFNYTRIHIELKLIFDTAALLYLNNLDSAEKCVISQRRSCLFILFNFPHRFFPARLQRRMNASPRVAIRLSSLRFGFLIGKLIKMKSEHRMVFKKFKWNNLHWECAKMLMHSFTKPLAITVIRFGRWLFSTWMPSFIIAKL